MERSNTEATARVSFDICLRMAEALRAEDVYIHSTLYKTHKIIPPQEKSILLKFSQSAPLTL